VARLGPHPIVTSQCSSTTFIPEFRSYSVADFSKVAIGFVPRRARPSGRPLPPAVAASTAHSSSPNLLAQGDAVIPHCDLSGTAVIKALHVAAHSARWDPLSSLFRRKRC
jgi:hypothetical protein